MEKLAKESQKRLETSLEQLYCQNVYKRAAHKFLCDCFS